MKRYFFMMAAIAFSLPLMAQETNSVPAVPVMKPAVAQKGKDAPDRADGFNARHIRFMDKVLQEIGVTEEQRKQITDLQSSHMEKMRENFMALKKAQQQFATLQDEGAAMEAIDKAIDEVAKAQADQLRILARNRRQMETILGQEKYNLFMEAAQRMFKEHDRRPGAGMPPRPDSPPPEENPVPPVPANTATTE